MSDLQEKPEIERFPNAPVIRVTFVLDFRYDDFPSVLLGRYWEQVKARFPVAEREEDPQITAQAEEELQNLSDRAIYQVFPLPPVRAAVFESADRSRELWLQPGRFHFAWNRRASEVTYPDFETLYGHFADEWTAFSEWLKADRGVLVEPLGLRLRYVNRLDASCGWSTLADGPKLLKHIPRTLPSLGSSDRVHVHFHCAIAGFGDLDVSYDVDNSDADNSKEQKAFLHINTKSDRNFGDLNSWFASARRHIYDAFLDFSTDDGLKAWRNISKLSSVEGTSV